MYPTFSGSSRRPRNVNLSGQTSNNPFASGAWGPSTGTGTAQSIANAQAERRQRQEERDRLKAAKDIQRTWRGHRSRRSLLQARRRDFDQLYSPSPSTDGAVEDRLALALPLILYLYDPGNDRDCQRLQQLAEDIEKTNYTYLSAIPRPNILLDLVLGTLDRSSNTSLSSSLFSLLVRFNTFSPDAVRNSLGSYFRLLAKHCQATIHNSDQLNHLIPAIVAPLQSEPGASGEGETSSRASVEFALNFLTQPLPALEPNMDMLGGHLSFQLLTSSIIDIFSSEATQVKTQDELLWLLSHFIALTASNVSAEDLHLRALLIQISDLATVIRARLQEKDNPSSRSASSNLHPYVKTQISSLVSSTAISRLLDGFTFGSESAQDIEKATLLAGYTLALLRVFPEQADEIRMRLYLADISTDGNKLPSLNVFWMAMKATSAFKRIRGSSAESALQFLAQRNYFQPPASSSNDSHWDREWRAILLFLELYTFVLRLTDDDDFFAKLGTEAKVSDQQPVSRLKTCSLSLDDLTNLTLFLKHLAFTLTYHSAELLRSTERSLSREPGCRQSLPGKDATFEVISGVSFPTFKDTVTTAASMLYERDSRRPFLPKDHWLMTATFEMAGFMSAVIMEEERLQELQDEDESDENSDGDEDGQALSPVHMDANVQRLSRQAAIERMRAEATKATKARIRAVHMPKLELLRHMPYVIPFKLRIAIFRQFIARDQQRRRDGFTDPDLWRLHMRQVSGNWPGSRGISRHHAKIKRGQIFEDAFSQFYELGDGLKEPIQITFVDRFDTVEAGIDGGGVTKEFLLSTTQEAFDPDRGFFIANSHNLLFPNPYAIDQREVTLQAAGMKTSDKYYQANITELLTRFEFLGRVVGKCLYEGILMNVSFAGFFLLKWSTGSGDNSGYRASINDLRELDEELYQGLMRLKNYNGDVSDLALDFTINDQVSDPSEPLQTKTRELEPNGSSLAVTNENRPLYISYTARHRLVAQPYRQTRAFLRGLESIIRPSWLSMFNQQELQRLVGGDSTEIDVEDLRKHTHYSGLYDPGTDTEDHPTIEMFWRLMQELQDVDRRAVLQYVTSTPRAPLLGFSQLNPPFSIRDAGTDESRLPSASTCVNLLKLPRYTRYETLKSKLLYAVRSNAGFDLS